MAYTFQDLSGTASPTEGENPFSALINACSNDATQIHNRYATHRTARNAQQKSLLLSPTFPGFTVDPILSALTLHQNPTTSSTTNTNNQIDPRHCLVFWARPPISIRTLISTIQSRLSASFPSLWLMPSENLHMTVLEITHSQPPEAIPPLLQKFSPQLLQKICQDSLTGDSNGKRGKVGLEKPLVSFDAQALAVSFLPEENGGGEGEGIDGDVGEFGYHHLRRDVWGLATGAGAEVQSRYAVPSAHLTVARFVTREGLEGRAGELVEVIEGLNEWLMKEYWGKEGSWVVGQEKGLESRKGTLWYGAGEQVYLGKGF